MVRAAVHWNGYANDDLRPRVECRLVTAPDLFRIVVAPGHPAERRVRDADVIEHLHRRGQRRRFWALVRVSATRPARRLTITR